jgi:hypothetical protein
MIIETTVVDQTGAVFTKSFDGFTLAIQAFNVDDFIDNVLQLSGVAPGNVTIRIKANFDVDGYFFNLFSNGDLSFGSGDLPRECAWPIRLPDAESLLQALPVNPF